MSPLTLLVLLVIFAQCLAFICLIWDVGFSAIINGAVIPIPKVVALILALAWLQVLGALA